MGAKDLWHDLMGGTNHLGKMLRIMRLAQIEKNKANVTGWFILSLHFGSLVSPLLFILQQVWRLQQVGDTPLTGTCSAATSSGTNVGRFIYPQFFSLSLSSEASAAGLQLHQTVVSRHVCALCVLQAGASSRRSFKVYKSSIVVRPNQTVSR